MQYFKSKASITGIATETNETGMHSKAVILANTSFKVVEGKNYTGQLPVASVMTDDKGQFYLQLPVGVYCIVEEERPEVFTLKKSSSTEKWDNRCRKKLWQTPLYILNITTTESKTVALQRRVTNNDPCLTKTIPDGKQRQK